MSNLVPYTITALSRQDIIDTPTNRNIVVGAVVTCQDALGAAVTMFDDAAGANGSTSKTTNADGQVTVFVDPGEYTFFTNGRGNKVILAPSRPVSSVASVDALRDMRGRFDGQQISLTSYTSGESNGSGILAWRSSATNTDDGIRWFAVTGVATGRWELIRGQILSNLSVSIPTEYPTLQAAIDDIHGRLIPAQGVIVDLLIEAGHQLTSGVSVASGDYGYFQISSVDATVLLAPTFPATDIIYGSRAVMPVLNCLINANGRGLNGYFAFDGSQGFVSSGKGVTMARQHGCYADSGSRISCRGSNFTFASQEAPLYSGILAWGSFIDAQGATVQSSSWYGAQAAAGGTLNFRNGIADGAVRYGIRATNGAKVNAREASAQNCVEKGIVAQEGSEAEARGANVSGSAIGYHSYHSSRISADVSTAENCTTACLAQFQSQIDFRQSSANGSATLINCLEGSSVGANTTTAIGCTSRAVICFQNSRADIGGANLSNCTADYVIFADQSSEVIARVVNVSGATGIPLYASELSKISAFFLNIGAGVPGLTGEVFRGGQILVSSGGVVNFNVTVLNQPDGNLGIVWR